MTQGAPEAATGSSLLVWGAAGRSVMPAIPGDPRQSLRVAATELAAAAGQAEHPCDVRFGRDAVEILARAQAQLSVKFR